MEKLPFIPNQIYNRRADIHAKYGGNWQGGITPSSKFPYIFIFTGKSGEAHGYQDHWDNENIFAYTGEGQSGDMKFTKGNLALQNHLETGKRVLLFEFVKKGFVKFITELEYFNAGYIEIPDTSGKMRIGIKFIFKRKGAYIPVASEDLKIENIEDPIALFDLKQKTPVETERIGLVKNRIGQNIFESG